VAGGDLTSALLKRVSRSFYLSLAVLPPALRPTLGLAYLLARAADTVADTRLIERHARIIHLDALRAEMRGSEPHRLAGVMAAAGSQSLPAERELLGRLPELYAAYRALPSEDRERVRRVIETIIEGMTQDLHLFPGEDEDTLAALETIEELDRYTYLVAGCVGEFWTEVHVAHRPRLRDWDLPAMRQLGIRFGKALQFTNVLRDVPRDLRHGRCYLPRQELAALGLAPRDLLDPMTLPAVRPLLGRLLDVALDHYEAGWRYTLAIPRAETRMRLACAWPLLIGLRTLDLVVRSPNWLDPAVTLKVPRLRVYGLMAHSLATVWSTRALGHQARRLRERIDSRTSRSERPAWGR
jgi:farnesyl-diphosphate farnesyltransferase